MLHGWRSSPIPALGGWRWVSSSVCPCGSALAVAVAWMCCDEHITDIAFKALLCAGLRRWLVSA